MVGVVALTPTTRAVLQVEDGGVAAIDLDLVAVRNWVRTVMMDSVVMVAIDSDRIVAVNSDVMAAADLDAVVVIESTAV